MQQGTIRFYSPSKGYGFVIPDEPSAPDCFFHVTKVAGLDVKEAQAKLQPGVKVMFESGMAPDRHRTRALKVELVDA